MRTPRNMLVPSLMAMAAALALTMKAPANAAAADAPGSGTSTQLTIVAEVQPWILNTQNWIARALVPIFDLTVLLNEPMAGTDALPSSAVPASTRQEIGVLLSEIPEIQARWEVLVAVVAEGAAENPGNAVLGYLDQYLRSQLLTINVVARMFSQALQEPEVDKTTFELNSEIVKLWQGMANLLFQQIHERLQGRAPIS